MFAVSIYRTKCYIARRRNPLYTWHFVSTTILFYLIVIRANSVTYSSLKQFNTKTGVLSIASSAGTLCCVADTIYHMVMKSGAISKLMSKGISTTTIQAVVVIVLLTMSFIAMYAECW